MSNQVVHYGKGDPFAAYAAQMGNAKLLRFSKGDYTAGEAAEEVPEGTQFMANMDELRIGWICWENSKPVEERMAASLMGSRRLLGPTWEGPRRRCGKQDQTVRKTRGS